MFLYVLVLASLFPFNLLPRWWAAWGQRDPRCSQAFVMLSLFSSASGENGFWWKKSMDDLWWFHNPSNDHMNDFEWHDVTWDRAAVNLWVHCFILLLHSFWANGRDQEFVLPVSTQSWQAPHSERLTLQALKPLSSSVYIQQEIGAFTIAHSRRTWTCHATCTELWDHHSI